MKRLFFVTVVLFAGLSVNAQTYFGDVDKNGSLNIGDVQCLSDMVLGKTTADKILGDVNRDNKVDVDDIAELIAVLLDPTKAVIAYDYVDLGLPSGTKWATCNVGTTTPEGYGDYFAWGETKPYYAEGHSQDSPCSNWVSGKTGYNWASYFDSSDGTTFTKYSAGVKTSLDLENDAAHVNWGGTWRMPTYEELQELYDKCTKTETTVNGVSGYRFSSNIEGYTDKSIFLPEAGYHFNKSFWDAGSDGYYWINSLYPTYSNSARNLHFLYGDVYYDYTPRCYGYSVRPVCQ